MTTEPIIRVAIPSKGRLREQCLDLLKHAGYSVGAFKGDNASAVVDGIEFIEMRPRDAAAWLKAGRLSAAFISTDTALESDVSDFPAIKLGFAKSDLIVACRDADAYQSADDLAGGTVATHLPDWTRRWFASKNIDVTVVAMGGSLEGVCAVGMADAIVDLRETGGSLARNHLRVIEEVVHCQAIFANTQNPSAVIDDLRLRIGAALSARRTQYLLLHIPADKVDELSTVFPGLAAPTVLPLAGRSDLVAAHLVVDRSELWTKLGDLRAMGASGIVALPTDAILA